MESKQNFGAYILRRRKELGLTQREFADRLYVTESAVSASVTLVPVLAEKHRGLVTLGAFTASLELLLWEGCRYANGDWFPLPALPGVLLGMILPWAWLGIIRYAPLCRRWKGAACLACAAALLPLVSPLLDRLVLLGGGEMERLHAFWFQADFTRWGDNWTSNENTLLLVWIGLVCAAGVCAVLALAGRRKKRN